LASFPGNTGPNISVQLYSKCGPEREFTKRKAANLQKWFGGEDFVLFWKVEDKPMTKPELAGLGQ
jgi:hypothetical protein